MIVKIILIVTAIISVLFTGYIIYTDMKDSGLFDVFNEDDFEEDEKVNKNIKKQQ